MKNIVLIGCGRIGKMHFDNLAIIDSINVKYIVDDYINADDFSEVIVKKASQLEEVLSDDQVDACVIAASSSAHVDLIKKAIDFRKHIFCEKPISFDVNALNELAHLVKEANLKLQVGLNRRFDPDFLALKNAIDKQKIGSIQIIKITNRDPRRPDLKFVGKSGGLFFDFNTHDFDMVHFLSGERVKEVYAIGDALIESRLKELGDIDTTLITLKLDSGALVMIDASRETNFGYDQRIEVFGSKGMLKVDNFSPTNVSCISSNNLQQSQLPYWSFVERYHQAYLNEFKAFADYLNASDDVGSPVGIDDMIQSVEVAMAVQRSYDNNQAIVL
ncbi:MAG: inositol 2-dehydrogenase [Gammaproteobacteria bacterium]|nr:MAG: inositol 2-dehydrogenase [Gammaproteobacteria bacterium]UTW42166.1 Gfo/Idh/MocA family oxidoreductase [bacterium SCSIO 12844]